MIYLVEDVGSGREHFNMLTAVITEHTSTPVTLIEIEGKLSSISSALVALREKVVATDIVLCAWAIPFNEPINNLLTQLTESCWVVAAAGNTGSSLDNVIPASTPNVITVGSLNKTGVKASSSNYSDVKTLVWAPGTNYMVNGVARSGTSIAAALYASFLAESIEARDRTLLDTKLSACKIKTMLTA